MEVLDKCNCCDIKGTLRRLEFGKLALRQHALTWNISLFGINGDFEVQ